MNRFSDAIDDRSTAEQLRDLNVDVITNRPPPTQVTGVVWAKKQKQTRRKKKIKPYVSICKRYMYLNITATELLDPAAKRYQIGGAKIGGKKGLIMREVKAGGYRISVVEHKNRRTVYATTTAPGLLKQLTDYGLKRGRYELVKAGGYEGVWLGVPEEGVEK